MLCLGAILFRLINSEECKMTKNSAARQANGSGAHPVSPENEMRAAERRRFEDALEDDEVYEALMSLHAEREAKENDWHTSKCAAVRCAMTAF